MPVSTPQLWEMFEHVENNMGQMWTHVETIRKMYAMPVPTPELWEMWEDVETMWKTYGKMYPCPCTLQTWGTHTGNVETY